MLEIVGWNMLDDRVYMTKSTVICIENAQVNTSNEKLGVLQELLIKSKRVTLYNKRGTSIK